MEVQHTRGPWHAGHTFVAAQLAIFADRRHIANVGSVFGRDDDEARANARLIAAAPDLALTLAWLLGLVEKPPADYDEQIGLAIAAAHLALEKAVQS